MLNTHQQRNDRARGALLGLAVGDAIGTTAEFKPRGSFPALTDMVGGGPFNLLPGQWTDDTSMALCLGHSLVEKGFDLHDQMQRYLNWHDHGYLSSTGRCFDIGCTTHNALERYRRTGQPVSGSADPDSAGNGSIMRLAPVPIFYMDTPELAIEMSQAQSRTTHQAPECLQACALLAGVLVNALNGISKIDLLYALQQNQASFTGAIRDIANWRFMRKTIDQIRGTGYVVQSLEAALWCFWQTDSYKDCVLMAANLGDDADTTAAIAGQVAGAFYGESGIPMKWLAILTMRQEIAELADRLVSVNIKPTQLPHVQPDDHAETTFGSHSQASRQSEPPCANPPETEAADPLLEPARALLTKYQNPSVAFLQRHLMLDSTRATALLKLFEDELVTVPDETGWRRMLASGQRSPDDPRYFDSPTGSTSVQATRSNS